MNIKNVEIPRDHICIDIDTEDGKAIHIHCEVKNEILEM